MTTITAPDGTRWVLYPDGDAHRLAEEASAS